MCVYIYIYIYMYVHIYIYIHISHNCLSQIQDVPVPMVLDESVHVQKLVPQD